MGGGHSSAWSPEATGGLGGVPPLHSSPWYGGTPPPWEGGHLVQGQPHSNARFGGFIRRDVVVGGGGGPQIRAVSAGSAQRGSSGPSSPPRPPRSCGCGSAGRCPPSAARGGPEPGLPVPQTPTPSPPHPYNVPGAPHGALSPEPAAAGGRAQSRGLTRTARPGAPAALPAPRADYNSRHSPRHHNSRHAPRRRRPTTAPGMQRAPTHPSTPRGGPGPVCRAPGLHYPECLAARGLRGAMGAARWACRER